MLDDLDHELERRGHVFVARQWAASRKGYWRLAGSAPLHRAMPNRYWTDLGLVGLGDRTSRLREHWLRPPRTCHAR
ncbi:MAG: hypothetical protein WEE50_11210 [Chloroflexota bacterium]